METTITVNADGTITVSPPDAWWCCECGRVAVLDAWDRCAPCAAAQRLEAQRITDDVMGRLDG